MRDGTVGSVHAYGSLRQAVSSTWQSEGLRGFFRGWASKNIFATCDLLLIDLHL